MKRIWVGILAIVVILAALALPYASGHIVEQQFHAVANQLERAIGVPVEVVSYHRGWFTSEADTRFGTADDGFLVHHAIDHNPLTAFALARVTSTPVLDDAQRLKQHFSGNLPLTSNTRFGFTGAIDVHAVSPAITQPLVLDNGATMRWGGLTADIHVADGRVTYSARIPQYGYRDDNGSLTVNNIKLQGAGPARRTPASADDWNTNTHLAVEQLLFDSTDAKAELALDVRIDSGLDRAGDYAMTAAIDVTDAVIQRLRDAETEPFRIQKAVVQTRLSRVSVEALKALLRDLATLRQQQPGPAPDALRRVFAAHLPKLLTRPAELQISVAEFSSNRGDFGLHAAASFDPASAETKQLLAILGMARRLNVTLRAGVDQSLAQYAAPGPNNRLLDLLVEQKLLLLQDNRYTLEARFDGPKHFTINGQPGMKALLWLRYLLPQSSGY